MTNRVLAMHPTTEQLLAFRDSPEDAYVAVHLAQCKECAALLDSAARVQAGLCKLPQLDAPADAWARIAARTAASDERTEARRMRARAAVFALAAGAAAMAVLFALRSGTDDAVQTEPKLQTMASEPTKSDALSSLIEQSRKLDVLLQELPERPRVERVSTAATLDTIEERIQWLDFQLSYAATGELDELEAQRLWRERVELMDSLVKVRYAQSGRVSF